MKHTDNTPTSPGPLGYWLRVIDRRLHERMREIFEAEGLTRRDWHRLNLIGGGAAPDARIAERLAAHPEKVAPLIDRGWVEGEPGAWRLTEAGETARDVQHERLASLRAQVAEAVGPEEYATTLASLETIARTLGWHEGARMPRGPRPGIRRHSGERPQDHGHGHDEHPHGHGGHHDHRGDRPTPAA
ncbi:MAG TPA: hypothetical protein VKA62_03185 [Agromyces sp.]|nr:hypothetical protein [Agromyces sp.]